MSKTMLKIHKTRYKELGFANINKSLWRFIDTETGCTVGEQYLTKDELLADLSRYAAFYGCVDALEPDPIENNSIILDSSRRQLLHALGYIANTSGSEAAYQVAIECAALMHSPSTIVNEGQRETGRAIYVAALEYWDSVSDDPIGKPG